MNRQLSILVVMANLALIGCRPTAQPAVVSTSVPQSGPQNAPQSLPTISPTAVPTQGATPTSGPVMTSNSSLTIIATIGPTCPGPVRLGQECTKPYQGEFAVLRPDGSEAARVSTDADGRAVVNLPPGDYTVSVRTDPGTKLPRAGSVEVSVSAGQAAEVTIELDTGIR
jgi:hypothetical protein